MGWLDHLRPSERAFAREAAGPEPLPKWLAGIAYDLGLTGEVDGPVESCLDPSCVICSGGTQTESPFTDNGYGGDGGWSDIDPPNGER